MPTKPRIDPRIATARKVDVVPIDELTEWDRNPHHGDVAAIRASLQRFGQVVPILRAPDGWVVAGNHTLKAMREEGYTHAAVVTATGDDDDLHALGLAMNRIAALGTDDDAAVLALLQGLDALDGTGYTPEDVEDLIAILEEADAKAAKTQAPTSTSNDQGVAAGEASLAERLEGYATKGVRSIVVDLDLETFAWWSQNVEAAREAVGVDTNAALIVTLVAGALGIDPPNLG